MEKLSEIKITTKTTKKELMDIIATLMEDNQKLMTQALSANEELEKLRSEQVEHVETIHNLRLYLKYVQKHTDKKFWNELMDVHSGMPGYATVRRKK